MRFFEDGNIGLGKAIGRDEAQTDDISSQVLLHLGMSDSRDLHGS